VKKLIVMQLIITFTEFVQNEVDYFGNKIQVTTTAILC
jgi:hypothetical protein